MDFSKHSKLSQISRLSRHAGSSQQRFHRSGLAVTAPAPVEPHRVLGISRCETDPVQIILAAQIHLRRWRRSEPGKTRDSLMCSLIVSPAHDRMTAGPQPVPLKPVGRTV
jgi:hypothetical protein